MAELKTRPTKADVEDYLYERGNDQQRDDCRELIAMMKKVTKQPPKMWGPSIVGFGSYKYTYASGHSGEMPVAAFAIRGRDLVIYLLPAQTGQQALLSKLGPHKMTKSCLHIKRLADVDTAVLQKLVADGVAEARRRYPG
jgi:hypothetical protein